MSDEPPFLRDAKPFYLKPWFIALDVAFMLLLTVVVLVVF